MSEGRRSYPSPRLLNRDDDIESFECRSAQQSEWLHKAGRSAHSARTARVFVVTEPDNPTVVGYYAWCMASIRAEEAPPRVLRGAGRYPRHPVALLARLGVDIRHENRKIGSRLLQDVITRAVEVSQQIGCLGLLVHAETEEAAKFYTRRIADFQPSPINPIHLVLQLAHARKALQSQF